MSQKQKTLKAPVSISGVGLHTGVNVNMIFKPAPENHGFKFMRTDLEGSPIIEADANYVGNTQRGTVLEKKGVKVYTTEHALAALVGLDIDNVLIEMDGPEPPIMDGSSIQFIEAIESVGLIEQDAERVYFEIKEVISYNCYACR
jgi:UDP-3-O-[3-hydroxymyristoyl] N-acetylglucosamine deacetylase/3-hydroxyacyl-[acyl-carrier-protein] dehydratase